LTQLLAREVKVVKIGLFGINMGACANPQSAIRVAKAAEQAGFESLWTGEHVVLPDPRKPPSPLPPEYPMLDPLIALGFISGNTAEIRLGTGIIILPQRNPLVLAKQLASVDVVSQGRLIFGVGIGYLKPEFDALGVPFEFKGPRTEEYLAAVTAMWTMERPEYHGRFVSFSGVNAMPRPVRKPHPQIVFGGHTRQAFDRAARLAGGWYGFSLDLDATAKCIARLRAACETAGRRFEDVEITVTPSVGNARALGTGAAQVTLDDARRFADLGVTRLVVAPWAKLDEAGLLKIVEETARDVIGRV
jgi:probable F420-dependent oxidoreductase